MFFNIFALVIFSGYLGIFIFIFWHLFHKRQLLIPRSQKTITLKHQMNKAIIEIKNVHKEFDSPVLKGISFSIYQGETLAILGRSGSGKSSILKLIAGLLRPDLGEILFKGKDISFMDESTLLELRKSISYVFQQGAVFDFLDVRENIAYPLREIGIKDEKSIQDRVNYLLDTVAIKDSSNLRNDELSVGARKQVAIARAIANDPEVILYDEPTTGVDPMIKKSLSHLIRKLNKDNGLTSIVVTHDLQCIETVADRMILIKNGTVRFEGKLSEFHVSSDPYVQAFIAGKLNDEEPDSL